MVSDNKYSVTRGIFNDAKVDGISYLDSFGVGSDLVGQKHAPLSYSGGPRALQ